LASISDYDSNAVRLLGYAGKVCLLMVNNDHESPFALLKKAVETDSADLTSEAVVAIDAAGKWSGGSPIEDSVFEIMLGSLTASVTKGICSWHVFFWFERNFTSLTDDQREEVWRFVSSQYGAIVEETTVLEVAEWVGSFRIYRALQVVREWLENLSIFRKYNATCVRATISELLSDVNGPIDIEWGRAVEELREQYRDRDPSL
jgi:hypothetical protein